MKAQKIKDVVYICLIQASVICYGGILLLEERKEFNEMMEFKLRNIPSLCVEKRTQQEKNSTLFDWSYNFEEMSWQ